MEEKRTTIRPAGRGDAAALADLHLLCASAQPGSFMARLGRGFFLKYYRILLDEPSTLILCADAGPDGLVGLVSATADAERQLRAIQKKRFSLFVSTLPALARRPSLAGQLFSRERSLSAASMGDGFIVGAGARIGYWGWRPDYPQKGTAVGLLKEILALLENRGACRVLLETDRVNRKVEVVHRILGARVVNEFTTPDGRERIVMEYELKGGKFPGAGV